MAFVLLLGLAILFLFATTVFFGAPFVPSHRRDVEEAFTELRPIDEGDVMLDLGGGAGGVCLVACQMGAEAVNFEINPLLALVSRIRMLKFREKATTRVANYLQVGFPGEVTVVYAFSDSRHIKGIYRKLEKEATRQGRGYDFISYGFEVPGVQCHKRSGTHFLYRVEPLLN